MDEGWLDSSRFLEKICHIHGHLLNGGVVECLNVPQGSLVILSHHVDGYSLSAKTTTATNPDTREKKLKLSSEQRTTVRCQTATWGEYFSIHVIPRWRVQIYSMALRSVNSGQLCWVWKCHSFSEHKIRSDFKHSEWQLSHCSSCNHIKPVLCQENVVSLQRNTSNEVVLHCPTNHTKKRYNWKSYMCNACATVIHMALVFLPVDIVFPIGWQVIVDDQGHLLDINTSGLRRNIMISYINSQFRKQKTQVQ